MKPIQPSHLSHHLEGCTDLGTDHSAVCTDATNKLITWLSIALIVVVCGALGVCLLGAATRTSLRKRFGIPGADRSSVHCDSDNVQDAPEVALMTNL